MALWFRLPSFQLGAAMSQRPPSNRRCFGSGQVISCNAVKGGIIRRSGNYRPPFWSNDFIQSLSSNYAGDGSYVKRIEGMKDAARKLLLDRKANNDIDRLEKIDALQRLGIAYHFEHEISEAVKEIFNEKYSKTNSCLERRVKEDDLYAISLEFRILRQHGYPVPEEVFSHFRDKRRNLKACLSEDLKGMLYLYEASHFLVEGENILEEAIDFTTKKLQEYTKKDYYLSRLISHALEMPLNWRMKRVEACWFIKFCGEYKSHNIESVFIELAKLDFNMVQAKHQDDLKHASSWWSETALGEKLDFARNRIVENFFWSVGLTFEPELKDCRRMLAKLNSFATTIDDIYDVYGTLEELELFTDAVIRWDVKVLDRLPDYMQICFLSLYNTTNSLGYELLISKGFHAIPYLRKLWVDLCKSYLLEAKWYYSGYTPSFKEYMDNSWISIAGPIMVVHAFFWITNPITTEAAQCFEDYPDIVRLSGTIVRFVDDLGTASEELMRGDVPKSIQCYMNETGVSEEEARDYIRSLIFATWKKLNREQLVPSNTSVLFSNAYKEACVNLARMAQCMYQYGDGHGVQDNTKTKDHVMSLFDQPILYSNSYP